VELDDSTTLVAQVPRTSVAAIATGDRVDVVLDPIPVLVVKD
jgi:hypothetical protein